MTHLDPSAAIRALASRAPRYTSYPPANRFTEAVGPRETEGWMRAVPEGSAISLYVHIPFCRRLCWFCACRTQGTPTGAPLGPYLDALEEEAALVADRLPSDVTLSYLHLGGGTPTFLDADQMARLFGMIDALLPRAPSAEVDPTEVDAARMDALASAGVTRASLGVQDFDPVVQAAIGRPQSLAQTRGALEGLRARGIDAINLDLLYGLPHQTLEGLACTLDAALSLVPDRIALYGYAYVPWASARQAMIPGDALPSPETRLEMAIAAGGRIEAAGYDTVGIDHYALPGDSLARAARSGTLRRNFQGYTTDAAEVLIGLGASSISRFPQGYAQNAPRTADWKARLAAGRLPVVRGHVLSDEDRLRGAMIERLLCDLALPPGADAGASHVRGLVAKATAAWPSIVRLDGAGSLRMSAEACHVARMVAMEFDEVIPGMDRHSAAV